MKPSKRYQQFLQQPSFCHDPVQQHMVQVFDRLHESLEMGLNRENTLISSFIGRLGKKHPPPKGLYIWGGVGRGKTFLMDIFFESLSFKNKKRVHFHRFMKEIHDRLKASGAIRNPLQKIASDYARQARLLCLDEFVVTDIGDAMLIGRLLDALFAHGVVLVSTSNTPPEDLYKDGLQRANFLPAINLLLQHCEIFNLDGGRDYRTLGLRQAELYRFPHSPDIETELLDFLHSHHVLSSRDDALIVNDRKVRYRYCAEDTIWFEFQELCESARSRLDYLEIAQSFSTLIVTAIRQMDDLSNDAARRFVSLIDVLYDHRVKLICTAEVAVCDLYRDGRLAFEFQRTVSRLLEMQSPEYIGLAHRID